MEVPSMLSKDSVMKELEKVIDPEIGIPITKMELIDRIDIDGSTVHIVFHGSMQFCPMAEQIGIDIRGKVKAMRGVGKVKVEITGHVNAGEINKRLNG